MPKNNNTFNKIYKILQAHESRLNLHYKLLSEMRDDIHTMKNDISSMKNDISNMKDDIGSMKNDISSMKDDIRNLYKNQLILTENIISMNKYLKAVIQNHEKRIQKLEKKL